MNKRNRRKIKRRNPTQSTIIKRYINQLSKYIDKDIIIDIKNQKNIKIEGFYGPSKIIIIST